MAIATLEIDQSLLQLLQAQANTQGLSIEALLRRLAENGNGLPTPANGVLANSEDEQETLGERLERKGLLGIVDSSQPRSDLPPHHTDFGQHLLEKHEQQLADQNTTIGERLRKRGLLGALDSSQPADPDSPPQRDSFFYLIAEELGKQGLKL